MTTLNEIKNEKYKNKNGYKEFIEYLQIISKYLNLSSCEYVVDPVDIKKRNLILRPWLYKIYGNFKYKYNNFKQEKAFLSLEFEKKTNQLKGIYLFYDDSGIAYTEILVITDEKKIKQIILENKLTK